MAAAVDERVDDGDLSAARHALVCSHIGIGIGIGIVGVTTLHWQTRVFANNVDFSNNGPTHMKKTYRETEMKMRKNEEEREIYYMPNTSLPFDKNVRRVLRVFRMLTRASINDFCCSICVVTKCDNEVCAVCAHVLHMVHTPKIVAVPVCKFVMFKICYTCPPPSPSQPFLHSSHLQDMSISFEARSFPFHQQKPSVLPCCRAGCFLLGISPIDLLLRSNGKAT